MKTETSEALDLVLASHRLGSVSGFFLGAAVAGWTTVLLLSGGRVGSWKWCWWWQGDEDGVVFVNSPRRRRHNDDVAVVHTATAAAPAAPPEPQVEPEPH